MPKILITGNGFDLKHGLPTFYKDFITILSKLKEIKEYNFNNIYSLSANFETIRKKYNSEFELNKENINKLIKLLDENKWFLFFKTELEIDSWIDFETKIEYVLKLVFSSVKHLQENIFNKSPYKIGEIVAKSTLFNNNIEILEVLNFFKIIDWYSENGNVVVKENFLYQKYNYNINVNTEKIAEHLYDEIQNFRKIFNLYFETFVTPLYENIRDQSINNTFRTINYHFTFNYTPTFQLLYKSEATTNYLHGKIGENPNLVLGINDIPNDVINKIHYIPFTKYFQKLNENTDFYFLNKIDKSKPLDYIFFFYGHSLDKSDEDYINEVFDFINTVDPSRIKKIIVIIHNRESKARLLSNLINIRGKDDIVKKMREDILQFILADSNELLKELNSSIDAPIFF
ncbi:hypothetical protein D1632_17010 [Chryseobacterium nematophagum]|uniref:Bacteriophage abortive infection AbiH n=1 Tax=Chryseobacterium nematophagum TaxID=2305228 RepID=A0A3M7L5L4_9FLAO|nr:AbiH family protein [Chryseobacterium nematophagum]RMZ58001.1 hypothetical protein D1632_17010 [Chryseobacterium nematophagum]